MQGGMQAPLSTTNARGRIISYQDVDETITPDKGSRLQVQDAGKARGSAAKRSHTASNVGSSARRSTVQQKKNLPANFAENVLEYELQIDQGKFTIDTINDLLLLYSQAVEYYNCINDDKYTIYQERI